MTDSGKLASACVHRASYRASEATRVLVGVQHRYLAECENYNVIRFIKEKILHLVWCNSFCCAMIV